MSTEQTNAEVEKKHRRLTITFSTIIRDTTTDHDAIAKAALHLEQVGLFTDVRHLSITVQGVAGPFAQTKTEPADRQDIAEAKPERAANA